MKKIALIEDDPDLFVLIKYNLEKEGLAVVGTQTGKEALELCSRELPDLLLLDIMLPDSDGLEICRQIRAHPRLAAVPLIFLTARASETDRVVGLELGANDYLVKPFFIRELIARVRVQLRGQSVARQTLRVAGLELERDSCRVLRHGAEVLLTATEFRLLDHLMSRPRDRIQPRSNPGCGLGSGQVGHTSHGGRAYSPASAKAGDGPLESVSASLRPWLWIHLRQGAARASS